MADEPTPQEPGFEPIKKPGGRKAAGGKSKPPPVSPHIAAAALILDPALREAEGRQRHAKLGEQKAALIAERLALLNRAPYDSETLGADLDWKQFKIDWQENGYDGPYVKETNRVYREAGKAYVGECERLRLEIGALSAEQIEISHAYARPELKAGYAVIAPWIEAAEIEAKRRYNAESVAIVQQWIDEGAGRVSVVDIPDPRKRAAIAHRTGTLHLPKRAQEIEASTNVQPEDSDEATQDPQNDQVEPWMGDGAPETEEPPTTSPEPPMEEPLDPIAEEPFEAESSPEPEASPEMESEPWLDLTFTDAKNKLDRLIATRPIPNDPDLRAAAYEIQTTSAGATVWEQAKWAANPGRLKEAHASRDRYRAWFQIVLGAKDAKAHDQSLGKLADAVHLRAEAKAGLAAGALDDPASPLGEALDRMSRQVAVAMIRGKTRIVEIDPPPRRTKGNPSPPILRAMARTDFFDLYANERYPVGDDQASIATVWFAWKPRRTYKKTVACRNPAGKRNPQSLLGPRL